MLSNQKLEIENELSKLIIYLKTSKRYKQFTKCYFRKYK